MYKFRFVFYFSQTIYVLDQQYIYNNQIECIQQVQIYIECCATYYYPLDSTINYTHKNEYNKNNDYDCNIIQINSINLILKYENIIL